MTEFCRRSNVDFVASNSTEAGLRMGFASAVNLYMNKWLQAVFVVLLASSFAFPQAKGKRLILKDGSYQVVREWKVQGDRVRYYSTERYMWEELPTSLVDFAATDRFAKEQTEQSDAISRSEVKQEEADHPTVAPGIRLPDTGGVYLLDRYSDKPELVELVQTGSEVNKQTGKNILRAVINPLPTGPRQSIELKGPRAQVQAHVGRPEIFLNINYSPDEPDATATAHAKDDGPEVNKLDRFRIVRVPVKKNARVVSNQKISLTGSIKQDQQIVPSHSTSLGTDWVKLEPDEALTAGEYAVVEMLSPKQMNLYVFDFGVDPNAPENRTAWKPAPVVESKTGTNETPVVIKRK
jgi:hypothetical protein